MAASTEPLEVTLPLSVLALLAVVTNIMVCVLVYKNKNNDMRSYTNMFVVSLAVSDILTSVVIFVQYVVGINSASVVNVAYALVMFSGVANVCAVTFDRYLAVMKPLQYTQRIAGLVRRLILACWSIPTVVSILPLTWGGNRNTIWHKIFVYAVLVLGIVAPFIFVMFADVCIFRQVRRCIKRERELVVKIDVLPGGERTRRVPRGMRMSSEVKVTQVFAIVALMFALSWLPVIYFTAAAAIGRAGDVPALITTISPFTLTLGTLVNPVLYSLMKPDFKRAVRVLLHCRRGPRTRLEIPMTDVTVQSSVIG